MTDRLERLRASLEEPLLVSSAANIRYLVGFASSNAALFVEPERTLLFSDFRYAEAGRSVEGVEFVETKRDVIAHMAEFLSGRFGFESPHLTYRAYEQLRTQRARCTRCDSGTGEVSKMLLTLPWPW